ncbi:prohead core protein [Helicobacter pylori]|nr:prohead core protein [Helicobacter pylori]RVZ25729.1 prohead core protein [Helicobacter pylori]
MSEPLETLDKDKQAMSEAIKKDIEKDKENLARVEADKKVKADESEKGYEKDDDKKAEKLDKEIAKDKASPNKDELYEEDDRVKRDKERDDALRDKEKAKDDACMVRADEDTIGDDEEYGDDDKLRDEILGVMEELCDTLNDSLNFKKVVCMGGKVSIAFKFLIFFALNLLEKIQILRIYLFLRIIGAIGFIAFK